LLDLGDGLGHFDTAGTGFGAVEGGTTAPHALFVVQDVEADLSTLVTGVKDKSVSINDGGRAKVLPIRPEDWAAGGAGSTEDALSGVIEACTVFGGLQSLFFRLGRSKQERLNLAVGLE